MPPAISAILDDPGNEVQAFLAAGHVCAVMGWREYEPLAERYRVPIVVTGFEPLDLLEGVRLAVEQLESGTAAVANAYSRVVTRDGNPAARAAVEQVFQVVDRAWRGIGTIDKEIAYAADKVVILAEEVVPESEMRKLPEGNQIPYFVVDAIVECPWGAFPSSVPFYYDYDAPFMRDMDKISRNLDDQKKWLDEWVYGPKSWEEFIVKLGAKRLLDLKADSVTGYSTRMMRGKKPAPRMKMPLSVAMSGY